MSVKKHYPGIRDVQNRIYQCQRAITLLQTEIAKLQQVAACLESLGEQGPGRPADIIEMVNETMADAAEGVPAL